MSRYENERRKLKNRVEMLEKVKADRDRLIEHLRRIETANGEVNPQLLMPKTGSGSP